MLCVFFRYAFYVKEVALNESRFSQIEMIKLSSGLPTQPQSFEASFLSDSSIYLKWRQPHEPNGQIIGYLYSLFFLTFYLISQ